MVSHGLHAVIAGLPPEPAVHGGAEIRQATGGCGLAAQQAVDAVDGQDDIQVNPGIGGAKLVQGREEQIVLAARVAGSARCSQSTGRPEMRHGVVSHPDQQAHVTRLVHRPFGERAIAEVSLAGSAGSAGQPFL